MRRDKRNSGRVSATTLPQSHPVADVPLKEAASSKRYDFVFMDLADAPGAARQLDGVSSRPAVVPVADKATDAELASAKAEYGLVVRRGKSLAYLASLDEAMGRRLQQVAAR